MRFLTGFDANTVSTGAGPVLQPTSRTLVMRLHESMVFFARHSAPASRLGFRLSGKAGERPTFSCITGARIRCGVARALSLYSGSQKQTVRVPRLFRNRVHSISEVFMGVFEEVFLFNAVSKDERGADVVPILHQSGLGT